MPKASIVMSVFNDIHFVKHSVESVLNQTMKDFELIIVDDCSTDGTSDYLSSITDPRVKIIKNFARLGLTKNLIKAIEVSEGEYIARMDADDISMSNRLEEQLSFMQKNPLIDVCGTSFIQINENAQRISAIDLPLKNDELKTAILLDRWSFAHPAVFMKRSVALYNPSYVYSQDLKLWLDLWAKCKFANLKDYLLLYRVHTKQISTDKRAEQDYYALKAYGSFIHPRNFDSHMILIGRRKIKNIKELFKVCIWFLKLNIQFKDLDINNGDLLYYSLQLLQRNFQSVFRIFFLKLGFR